LAVKVFFVRAAGVLAKGRIRLAGRMFDMPTLQDRNMLQCELYRQTDIFYWLPLILLCVISIRIQRFSGIFASRLERASVMVLLARTHTFRWTTLLFGDRKHKQYKTCQ
jgi:hypothetical protein